MILSSGQGSRDEEYQYLQCNNPLGLHYMFHKPQASPQVMSFQAPSFTGSQSSRLFGDYRNLKLGHELRCALPNGFVNMKMTFRTSNEQTFFLFSFFLFIFFLVRVFSSYYYLFNCCLSCRCPFPFGVQGKMCNSNESIADHYSFFYIVCLWMTSKPL